MDRTPIVFTDREIVLIKASLPENVNQRRLALLPKILQEWSCTDLKSHLSRESQTVISGRQKALRLAAEQAARFASALAKLDPSSRALVALQMAGRGKVKPYYVLGTPEHVEADRRIANEADFLKDFAMAAPNAWGKPVSGRPRNIVAYLVLQDLASIFEYVTMHRASRSFDRVHQEESGPFWKFSASVWPLVFEKGDDGLPAAITNWASLRKKYDEVSALVVNIHLLHPTWGIFDD